MIQYVATEYGVVSLPGKSLRERAEAMLPSPTRTFGRSCCDTPGDTLSETRAAEMLCLYK